MKIIHLLYRATVGGTERTVFNLIQQQLQNGYEVKCIILSNSGGFLEKYKSLLNENLFLQNINTFQGIWKLFKLLKQFDRSWIIHNHVRNLKLGLILKFVNNSRLLNEHILTEKLKDIDPNVYKKLKLFYSWYEKDYKFIISVSEAVKKALVDELDIHSDKVKVIYNGIEDGRLSNMDPNGSFHIGNATHFEKIKNIDLFIAIAEELIKIDKSFKFYLIGDGSQKAKIRNYIQKRNLFQKIILLDSQEDLTQFFSQLDLGLITSFSETFSLFAAECLARGIPVVATAVGGLKEVVKDNHCGYLIESFDKKDFVEKILKLKIESSTYQTFSKNSRQYSQKFMIKNIFHDYHKLYNHIINVEC